MRDNNEENTLLAGVFHDSKRRWRLLRTDRNEVKMSGQQENLFSRVGHKLEVFICQITEEIRNPLTKVSCLLMKAAQKTGMLSNYKPPGDQLQAIAELVNEGINSRLY